MCNNYKQALHNLNTMVVQLAWAKAKLNIPSDAVMAGWIKLKKDYLLSLKSVPKEDILQMEYVRLLVLLNTAEYVWKTIFLSP